MAFTHPKVEYDVSAANADGRLLVVASIDQGRSKLYGSIWGDNGGRIYIHYRRDTFAATEEEIIEVRLERSPKQYDSLLYIAPDDGSGLDDGCVPMLLDRLRYARAAKPTFERLVEMGFVIDRGGCYMAIKGFELLTRNKNRFELLASSLPTRTRSRSSTVGSTREAPWAQIMETKGSCAETFAVRDTSCDSSARTSTSIPSKLSGRSF